MFDTTDWTSPEDVENVRRSIAMQNTGSWAIAREPALDALDELLALLRAAGPQPGDLLHRVQQDGSQVHRSAMTDR